MTPVPASTTAKRGSPLVIRLKIKNISARSCTRDVGADAQELYIDQGARKFWSSDTCSADRSSNVQTLHAGRRARVHGHLERPPVQQVRRRPRRRPGPAARPVRGPRPPGHQVSEPVALTIAD